VTSELANVVVELQVTSVVMIKQLPYAVMNVISDPRLVTTDTAVSTLL